MVWRASSDQCDFYLTVRLSQSCSPKFTSHFAWLWSSIFAAFNRCWPSFPRSIDWDDQGWHPFAPASLHTGFFARSLFTHLRQEANPCRRVLSLPPDPTNSENQRGVETWQRIVGGLLWLSTRTRPDLAFAILPLLKFSLRKLSFWRWNFDTLRNAWALLNFGTKLWACFTHTRETDILSQGQATLFISLLPTLATSFIRNLLRETKIAKQNSMLLPLLASLPEVLGFSSRSWTHQPSHSQSLAHFVTNFHSQWVSIART